MTRDFASVRSLSADLQINPDDGRVTAGETLKAKSIQGIYLLRSGSSNDTIERLNEAGIDMTTAAPIKTLTLRLLLLVHRQLGGYGLANIH